MKVIAFNGSARPEGNTSRLIRQALRPMEQEGIITEVISLAGSRIQGCTACYNCLGSKNNRCVITDDMVNNCIEKMIAADGIIIASPTYFADITSETKALIDRTGFVARANGELFKRKVGAGIVAVRRGGAIHAFDSINHFFLISQMIIPGSNYWNVGIGLKPGDVEQDEEGMKTMTTLGENMAWLLKRTVGNSNSVPVRPLKT